MKKREYIKKSLLYLTILCFIVTGINATVEIQDIEYSRGDGFFRLHFTADGILSTPDIVNNNDNGNVVVMRIFDAKFVTQKDLYTYQSPILDTVKILRNSNHTDIAITLKQKADWRISTNKRGLFVEFQYDKNQIDPAGALSKSGSQKALLHSDRDKPVNPKSDPASPGKNDPGKKILTGVLIGKKDPGKIKINLCLNHIPEYKVIPLKNDPPRLAIDLIDTTSKRIVQTVNHLNVKGIRGAYNRPEVFRIVFDLDYLKYYKVSAHPGMLSVEFFKDAESFKLARANPVKAKPKVNPPESQLNTQSKEQPGEEIKEQKIQTQKAPVADSKKSTPGNGGNTVKSKKGSGEQSKSSGTSQAIKLEDSKQEKILVGDKPSKKEVDQNPTQLNKVKPDQDTDEFFAKMKSKSSADGLGVNPQEEKSDDQLNYLKKTVVDSRKYAGEPMNFSFYDTDIKDFLLFIGKETGLNIVMDPTVSGKVTGELIQVPWDQALEIFLKQNGLAMVMEGTNVLRIGKIDDLAAEAEKTRRLNEAKQMEIKLQVFTRALSYSKASEVANVIKKYITQRGSVEVDARTNQLIISEIPERIQDIDRLIDVIDTPTPQVSVEARIVETNTNFKRNLGVQWGYRMAADARYGNQTSLKFPNSVNIDGTQIFSEQNPGMANQMGGYAINLPAPGRTSGTVFSFGNVAGTFNLDLALTAMEEKGEGKIISAPKITVLNNEEAKIIQGEQIPIQVVMNRTVSVRFQQASLELTVTPQITARGTVMATLDIKNNRPDYANPVQGIPPIITQSVKSTVEIKDGATLVIGGLYKVEAENKSERVPLLSKIPLLGNLFKNSNRVRSQKELLVFITPRIIK